MSKERFQGRNEPEVYPMRQYEVCENEWSSFFCHFNKSHRGEPVHLTVYDPEHTVIEPSDPTPIVATDLTLDEICLDDPRHQIYIYGDEDGHENGLSRTIDRPCRLVLHKAGKEDDTLEIHSQDGLRTCLSVEHCARGLVS